MKLFRKKIDKNVVPLTERDRQIKERLETMNRQSVLALEAERIARQKNIIFKVAFVEVGIRRSTTFHLN